jgi:hypothetical protein
MLDDAWRRSRAQGQTQLSLLAAASEGAPADWGRSWLDETPGKEPSLMQSPYALALAAREGRLQGEALRQALAQSAQFKDTAPQLTEFVVAVSSGRADGRAEQMLAGTPIELRGLVLTMSQVILRDKTPPSWRRQARAFLFLGERPYLAPVASVSAPSPVAGRRAS